MHTLIVGITLSGKSTAAKQIIRQFRRKDRSSLVFDPLLDTGYRECGAALHTRDRDQFLKTVWNSYSCFVLFDEGGASVGRYDKEIQEVFTMGRHNGHIIGVICQKPVQLAPIVRDQCTNLLLFNSSLSTGKLLADEYNSPALIGCTALKQGEYYFKNKFKPLEKRRVF